MLNSLFFMIVQISNIIICSAMSFGKFLLTLFLYLQGFFLNCVIHMRKTMLSIERCSIFTS